jgi:long-chain acyl-CoA synthetase
MYRYEQHLREDRGIFPLSELAERAANDFGPRMVMRTWNGASYDETTYDEFRDKVSAVARWLVDRGVGKGDRIAVLGENSPEWAQTYLGVQAAGAVIVPVDSIMPSDGIRHIIADSEVRFLFASPKFLRVIVETDPIPTLEETICFGCEAAESIPWSRVIEEGALSDSPLPKREMDELAAIIYTSGTTGHSKGVMLSQNNIMSNVAALSRILPLGTEDTFLSVLPLHHTYECTVGLLLPLYCGSSITVAHSMKSSDLVAHMRNTNVTIMVGVPLLFEKFFGSIRLKIRKRSAPARGLFQLMYGVVAAGERMGLRLGKAVFRGSREKGGLGTVQYFISGGGPLDPAISVFFNRFGICLLQGYGLTETSPVTHVNLVARIRHGTVGPPMHNVECKIANPDAEGVGEICIRGPNVFTGYYNNEDATREVVKEDGWFHTGDLGRIFPDDYLQITGRLKNVLVTSGGKNVYPEEIEQHLNRSRFIAECMVLAVERDTGYGDEVAAIIYPDHEQVSVHFNALAQKPSDDDVLSLIKREIDHAQRNLEDFKLVRRFHLTKEEFQKTSTRKIKRFLYSGEILR